MDRKSFLMYVSFYEPLKHLSDECLGKLLRALYEYHINGSTEVEPSISMAFLFIKNQMDIDNQKYNKIVERNKNNGSKGGRPQKKVSENEEVKETQDNPKNPLGNLGTQKSRSKLKEEEEERSKLKEEVLKKDTKVSKESDIGKDSLEDFKEEVSISPNGQEEITPPVAPPPPKETPKQKKLKAEAEFSNALIEMINEDGQDDLVEAFMEVRKNKNLTNSHKAFELLTNQFEQAGLSIKQGLELCVLKGWGSFMASWYNKPTSPSRPPRTPEPAPPLEVLSDDDYDTGGLSNHDYLCKLMEQYEQ